MKTSSAARRALGVLCLLFAVASAAPAAAVTLLDDHGLKLSHATFVEGGYLYSVVPSDFDPSFGPGLNLARFKTTGRAKELGGAKLEVDFAKGSAAVKNAYAHAAVGPIQFASGYMKVPLSRDFLISSPNGMFRDRGMLVGLTPKERLGAYVWYDVDGDAISVRSNLGIADPSRAPYWLDDGQLLVGRVEATFPVGLGVHFGFVERAGPRRDPNPDDPEDPPPAFEHMLDATLFLERGALYVHVEGLTGLRSGFEVFGLTSYAAYRFGEAPPKDSWSPSWQLEPVLGYDNLVGDDFDVHRGRASLNVYGLGPRLVWQFNYELSFDDAVAEHAASALLQVGI